MQILAAHPHSLAVLFDQAETIEHARPRIVAAGYADRCRMVSGSFLESVPGGGDAYVIKHVLRDWDDDRAATRFSAIATARCRPAPCSWWWKPRSIRNGKDRLLKLLDFEGGTFLPGRLRTHAEMKQLLERAGFRALGIHPTGVIDSLVFEAEKRNHGAATECVTSSGCS